MNFRYDINGLRALAVIAVVLFHFDPAFVPGGFSGVDVFFVISGFLMTKIIFKGLYNRDFNLFYFYVARANRIIPALTVLCLALLVFGWFYLTPLDYKALGKHAASSMGFLSNIIYWRESGYFDVASHEKWLLHTWSLSVEWQFYIIYPIVLISLKHFLSIDALKLLILIGTVLGFIFGIVVTIKLPDAAYYILPSRSWEMMIGGVAFLYPWNITEKKKKVIELTGFLLILASYAFVSRDIPWPGYFAIAPVFGAYLMIIANQQSSIISNNFIFQYLGKWSYSIYLWHWPVVVYGYLFNVDGWLLYGLVLSVIFGFLSFRYVESLNFKSFSRWNDILKVIPVFMVLIVGGSALVLFHHPQLQLVSRYNDSKNIDFFINGMNQTYSDTKAYTWRNIEKIEEVVVSGEGVLVVGDSQAGDFTNILINLNVDEHYSLSSSIVSAKCGIGYLNNQDISLWRELSTDIKNNPNLEDLCIEEWQDVKSNIEKNFSVKTIFYAMNWREYSFSLLRESIASIKEINPHAKVVVVGKKGNAMNLLNEDIYADLESIAFTSVEEIMSIDDRAERLSSFGDDFIELYSKFCNVDNKTCTISYNDVPIFYDNVHSTTSGVLFLSHKIENDVSRILHSN